MTETKSCTNCKYCYVDDLFYEFCCRLPKHRVSLDNEGDPTESTTCSEWEGDYELYYGGN